MDTLINSIAAFFIQHSFAQTITGYMVRILGCLFALLLITAGLFLAFGKQKGFYYQQGSLVDKCWKAGWLLETIAVFDLSYRLFSGARQMSAVEIGFDCVPTALLMFAQIYGIKYHKSAVAAKRDAKKALS